MQKNKIEKAKQQIDFEILHLFRQIDIFSYENTIVPQSRHNVSEKKKKITVLNRQLII